MNPSEAKVERKGIGSTVSYTVTAGDVVVHFAANAAQHPSLSIAGHPFRWGFDRPSPYQKVEDALGKRGSYWMKPAEYAESLKPWLVDVATLGSSTRAALLADEQRHAERHAATLADSLKKASKTLAAIEAIPR